MMTDFVKQAMEQRMGTEIKVRGSFNMEGCCII